MRINIARFLKYIVFVVVLFWLLVSYPLFKFASAEFIKSFVVGFLISLTNFVVGFLLIKRGINKPNKVFFRLTLGSIGARLLAIGGLVIIFLKFLSFEIYGLVISLLLSYFVFLLVEVLLLSKLITKEEPTEGVG